MDYQGTDLKCIHDVLLVVLLGYTICTLKLVKKFLITNKHIQKSEVALSSQVSYVSKRIPITGSLWPPSGWSRWPLNIKLLQIIRIPRPL